MQRPNEILHSVSDDDWQQTPHAVRTLVLGWFERVRHLEQVVEQQTAQISALQQELARRKGHGRRGAQADSSGSTAGSKAPRRKRKRRATGRSPGGQPGHAGHGRSLLPVEQVDHVEAVKPDTCRGCGRALCGDDPHPQRHQEVVIPPVRAETIEYQLHSLRCPHCDTVTEPAWPDGVPRRTFGPTVQAWVGLLAGAYRLSKRNIAALMSDAFGVRMSVGTVSQLEQEVSAALAAPVKAAWEYVRREPVVNLDETSWREHRVTKWLWAGVTKLVSVFAIRASRGREVVDELLGADHSAFVGSDRYSAYGHLPVSRRQFCWSHLARAFEEFAARDGEAAEIGERLLECKNQLFTWWHRVRDGTLQRSSFQRYVSDLRLRVWFELWYGQQFADAKTAATCGNLLAAESAMWTFVRDAGFEVEPTNNAAERALRHAVIWRNTSQGTHSPAGSRFVERMLTVRESLRRQERNILDYLSSACHAALHNKPAPSILPKAASPSV